MKCQYTHIRNQFYHHFYFNSKLTINCLLVFPEFPTLIPRTPTTGGLLFTECVQWSSAVLPGQFK